MQPQPEEYLDDIDRAALFFVECHENGTITVSADTRSNKSSEPGFIEKMQRLAGLDSPSKAKALLSQYSVDDFTQALTVTLKVPQSSVLSYLPFYNTVVGAPEPVSQAVDAFATSQFLLFVKQHDTLICRVITNTYAFVARDDKNKIYWLENGQASSLDLSDNDTSKLAAWNALQANLQARVEMRPCVTDMIIPSYPQTRLSLNQFDLQQLALGSDNQVSNMLRLSSVSQLRLSEAITVSPFISQIASYVISDQGFKLTRTAISMHEEVTCRQASIHKPSAPKLPT